MFNKYKKNFFSQNGEDGIILELIRRLKFKSKKKWCCEFGAWDGIHGSNTFNLVKKYNFNAVYIEGNKNRFRDLLKTQKKYPKIEAFNFYVDRKKNSTNSLYKVLKKTKITKNFEILSIDIDSYDLDIWKSLIFYQPKIVISDVEFLKSLPKREIVCGYGEVFKHSLILNEKILDGRISKTNSDCRRYFTRSRRINS